MFSGSDDPWSFRSRWYEARKRALTLACLPAQRYGTGYEPGCANGELSAALAERCDRLLVSDGSARAVALARQRLAGLRHVDVQQAWLPAQWPAGRFDLIVISELAYFLDAPDIDVLADQVRGALLPGGTVLACHWRWPIEGCALDGDAVQARLQQRFEGRQRERPALHPLCGVVEADLRLQVWSQDPRSVAQREGFI
jgi:SAM-dependent methyltransferase